MACQFEVLLCPGQHEQGVAAAVAALDVVEELESQMTVYREQSEIMRVNRSAAAGPVPVEPRLFQLLQLALRLDVETGGAFDITTSPLTRAWGFFQRKGAIPGEADLHAALACVGSRHLQLDPQCHTVHFLQPGLEINLGAIGKGYALDRCAEQLRAAGVENFLVHGGRSSVLARGSHGDAQMQAGWEVGVQDPLRPSRPLARILLRDRALGTSGSGTQFFRHLGKRYGHILDPRTGRPAEGVRSATVVAPTAAEADALSTAFYVNGADWAADYCRRHSGYAMLLLQQEADEEPVKIRHEGFAEGELTIV